MPQQDNNAPHVRFDYRLYGIGWARADLGVGSTQVSLSVSYLTDGLGDIVRAAIGVAEGVQDQIVIWVEEPGYNELAISQRADTVTVQIWHYRRMSPDHVGDLGEPRLHARCSAKDFTTAICAGAENVLALHGEAGYREQWHANDFPTADVALLAHLLLATDG